MLQLQLVKFPYIHHFSCFNNQKSTIFHGQIRNFITISLCSSAIHPTPAVPATIVHGNLCPTAGAEEAFGQSGGFPFAQGGLVTSRDVVTEDFWMILQQNLQNFTKQHGDSPKINMEFEHLFMIGNLVYFASAVGFMMDILNISRKTTFAGFVGMVYDHPLIIC